MHALKGRPCHQGLRARNREQTCALDHKKRSETLAGPEARITHGVDQPGRPAELVADRLPVEQPAKQDLSLRGYIVQAILELRRRVHTVPIVFPMVWTLAPAF
jgi:hypothetical protein